MRILVAIANYGMKNIDYAKRIASEYLSMSYDIDIVFLAESEKDYGLNVRVLVGLPTDDPWSLPFGHKTLFADNLEKYDLFVYSEDDTLLTQDNLNAFLHASRSFREDFVPGFIRYEISSSGEKSYPDVHGPDHWIPGSVKRMGDHVVAEFSNEHSACFVLTQSQLRKAISSGGFLVDPHSGRYDLLCAAATDPYTQCGLKKVICISHLKDFEIHHLPNAYSGRLGLDEKSFQMEISALYEVLHHKKASSELIHSIKKLETPLWDKSYYDPCRYEIARLVPRSAREVLSIGCGSGETESYLTEQGMVVTAVPLDAVIATLAENRGIQILPSDLERALGLLKGKKFDAVVMVDMVQHLEDPVAVISKLRVHVRDEGLLIGSVPNTSVLRRLVGRFIARTKRWSELRGDFARTGFTMTSQTSIKKWLRSSGFRIKTLAYYRGEKDTKKRNALMAPLLPIVGPEILFSAIVSRETCAGSGREHGEICD